MANTNTNTNTNTLYANVWYVAESDTWQRGGSVSFDVAREWAINERRNGRHVITNTVKAWDIIGLPDGPPRAA